MKPMPKPKRGAPTISQSSADSLQRIARLIPLKHRGLIRDDLKRLQTQLGCPDEDLCVDRRTVRWRVQRENGTMPRRYVGRWEDDTRQQSYTLDELAALIGRSPQSVRAYLAKGNGQAKLLVKGRTSKRTYKPRTLIVYGPLKATTTTTV